jgi:hypothetical protein
VSTLEKIDPNQFINWLPSRLFQQDGEIFLEWIYLWDIHFDKPFFDETLSQCRTENSIKGSEQKEKRITPVGFLSEVGSKVKSVEPSLFIFHASRCGSTLTTQVLSIDKSTIVFPEYSIVDEILRANINGQPVDVEMRKEWLINLVKIMGQKRFDKEKHLIIKLDCWHFSFHSIIRKLFPEVLFAILYREPEAILRSNNKQWGMQFIPALVSPTTYGLVEDKSESFHFNNYANKVLQKIYSSIIENACSDENIMLFNYDDGFEKNIQQLSERLSFDPSFMKRQDVIQRMQFHSKHPHTQFAIEKTTLNEFAFDETIAIYNCVVQLHNQIKQKQ